MAEVKQQIFIWHGSDRRGTRLQGELRSSSSSMVKADLRRQGINPTRVKKKPVSLFAGRKSKITTKDIAVFSRQLATMMSAGVPLVQAFDIIGRGHDNPAMQDMVLAIKSNVESGNPLADSLAKFPKQFDHLFCNLVRAGEQAGILESLLHKIATYKEKTEALKGKIKKAMFYPATVIVVAFVITAILLIFVVPQFQTLFQGFGADLPALTLMVIQLSAIFQEWWWVIFGGIGASIYAIISARRRSKAFNEAWDRMILKVPVMGKIITKATIARYSRTLATMFAAGVPLVEALYTVSGSTGNAVYQNAVLRIRDEVATGMTLNLSMKQCGLFPNMVVQMVAIGEESGSLDGMLNKVADFFEEEVDNAVDGLSSLIEPFIMALLGIIIGGLVVAMYLPIFKLGEIV